MATSPSFWGSFLGGGGASGGLASAFNPASLGAAAGSAGLSMAGGLAAGALGELLSKPGKRRARKRRDAYIEGQRATLSDAAESAKDGIRRDLVEARSQIGQSMVDRGLYSSTALDGATQQANTAAAEQMAGLDRDRAAQLAQITADANASMPRFNYGEQIGGILANALTKAPQLPADPGGAPADTGGGFWGSLGGKAAQAGQAVANVNDSDVYRQASLASLGANAPGVGALASVAGVASDWLGRERAALKKRNEVAGAGNRGDN